MRRLESANRLRGAENTVRGVVYFDDFSQTPLSNIWDYHGEANPIYVVQTNRGIVERCLLMTTDPGDLVLDPTCGSGTTAYVAEQWGRRWITIDTSRVAIALARQRLLTAKYDYYEQEQPNAPLHPERNKFVYKTVPHITLKSIAQNQALDPIFAQWDPVLAEKLAALNAALPQVTAEIRTRLQQKLAAKEKAEGKSSITDADRRRWLLPKAKWEEWEVPFDSDAEWPTALQETLTAYRQAWRHKMDAVNACIAASAQQETLVDQPKLVKNVVRVTGPFTVEGLQPAEETLDLESPIGGEPDVLETFAPDGGAAADQRRRLPEQHAAPVAPGRRALPQQPGGPLRPPRPAAQLHPPRRGRMDAGRSGAPGGGDAWPTIWAGDRQTGGRLPVGRLTPGRG